MNIWALDKDISIKHLLLLLAQDLGKDAFVLRDVEALHPKSIRIGSRETPATAYLYTYGQAQEHYGLHLEYPYNEESNISELEEIYEGLDYANLLESVKGHLQLVQQTMGPAMEHCR